MVLSWYAPRPSYQDAAVSSFLKKRRLIPPNASEFNAAFPMEGSNTRSIYQVLLDALCND